MNQTVMNIKRAQKASLLFRTISKLFTEAALDYPELHSLFISKTELSQNKSTCYVFFFLSQGEEHFQKLMPQLILFKPSLRAAIAKEISGRYTPDLKFRFDRGQAKAQQMDDIFAKLNTENR